jgi:hypothetical protein
MLIAIFNLDVVFLSFFFFFHLQWAYTPVTTEKFLDLVTMYCQVNLLWSLIADRRTIAAGFARAFNVVKSQNESNFPKVAQYLVRCSSFLLHFTET